MPPKKKSKSKKRKPLLEMPPIYQKWTEENILKLGKELLAWFDEDDTNVFFEAFLQKKHLYRGCIAYLSDKSTSFSAIVKKAKQKQELKIAALALHGRVHPSMAMFLLKAKHGYQDKPMDLDTGSVTFVLE